MELLKTAFEASLPIVQVGTDDLVNAVDVIKHILKVTPTALPGLDVSNVTSSKTKLFYGTAIDYKDHQLAHLYQQLVKRGWTAIMINPVRQSPLMFNAGSLPVPKSMMREQVASVCDNEEDIDRIMLRLGATSLKDAAELIRLTMVNTGELTPKAVAHTRRELFKSSTGILPVNTEQTLYIPDDDLTDWMGIEKDYFLKGEDARLRARGILLDGPAGTGKSSAAKHIAEQWGIPLYLLNLGGMKSKWLGESQNNLITAVATIEREAPCVLLLDEIEKYYGGSSDADGGASAEMLGHLLWWLAEHRSRVLTVMTTNNKKKLPPELYRPGRIDLVMQIEALNKDRALDLIDKVVATFTTGKDGKVMAMKIRANFDAQSKHETEFTPAFITNFCYAQMKKLGFGL